MAADPCSSCGAALGARAGCQAAFDELSALAWTASARGAVHNLVVDTYAMQHPEEYGRSAKSYAAHLTALCCGVEHPGDQKLYWGIARWLDGPVSLEKPPVLQTRGRLTIASVVAPPSDEAYGELVRRWAADVWQAYGAQQAIARNWLTAVQANMAAVHPKRR